MLRAALIACALVLAASGQAWSAQRLAVVIGNAEYRSARLADLPNAANDAASLGRALEGRGFAVILASNVTAAGLSALLTQAVAQARAEVVLVFFAGHAVVAAGETFLLPTDAPDPTSLEALIASALPLNRLTASLRDPRRPTLVLLDACSEGRIGAERELDDNVFLAAASQPGTPAWDGAAGGNSPFTRALLQALARKESSLAEIMAFTRAETVRLSQGRQLPFSRSTLHDAFSFSAPPAAVPPGG